MLNLFFIFLGGAIGSGVRFGILSIFHSFIATFVANIIGCFLFGVFVVIILKKKKYIPKYFSSALTTGFCGGLTTFSTFSYEVTFYIMQNRYIFAAYYIFLSLFVGIISVNVGIELGRVLLKLHLDKRRSILHKEFIEGK